MLSEAPEGLILYQETVYFYAKEAIQTHQSLNY